MRILTAAAGALVLLAGCFNREPNYRNYGARPHEWTLPGPETEEKVFGPLPHDEVRDFVREMESQGWEVIGYEPADSGDETVLRNCPFRHVAQTRPEIVCQMNLAFVAGVVDGTRARLRRAVLSPSADRCCVVVTS